MGVYGSHLREDPAGLEAIVDRLGSPVAIPEVSVLGTAWRAGAQSTVQAAPPSSGCKGLRKLYNDYRNFGAYHTEGGSHAENSNTKTERRLQEHRRPNRLSSCCLFDESAIADRAQDACAECCEGAKAQESAPKAPGRKTKSRTKGR